MPVGVHLPVSISMLHAVMAGVETVEHSDTLMESGLRVHKLGGSVADANAGVSLGNAVDVKAGITTGVGTSGVDLGANASVGAGAGADAD